MNSYMTEDEQVEAIKRCWTRYGNHFLTAVLLILLAVMGTKWYHQYRFNIKAQASGSFEQLMKHYALKDDTGIDAQSNYLLSNYEGTVYASGSALVLAKEAVSQGKYDVAAKHLEWVKAHSDVPALQQVARLRLARVLLMQKKYTDSLSLLTTVEDKAYMMMVHEIKGDVFLAQNNKQKAHQEYLLAVKEVPKKNVVPPELKMKLNHVTAPVSHIANASIAISEHDQKNRLG
jgi:predicted negative regulator of RcsB-dependent stress response